MSGGVKFPTTFFKIENKAQILRVINKMIAITHEGSISMVYMILQYPNFNPNQMGVNHIGEEWKNNQGVKFTIVRVDGFREHKNEKTYEVMFEDGSPKGGVRYDRIREGKVAHPKRLSRCKTCGCLFYGNYRKKECDMCAKIKKTKEELKISKIRFKMRVDKLSRDWLKNIDAILSPPEFDIYKKYESMVGKQYKTKSGFLFKLFSFDGFKLYSTQRVPLFTIKFEDGTLKSGVQLNHIKSGEVDHPNKRAAESSGERCVREILERLNIEFTQEYSLSWLRGRRMDFFIKSLALIIEFDGAQHFIEVERFRKSLEEQQRIDDIKHSLCVEHGLDVWHIADDKPYIEGYRYPVHTLEELPKMLLERLKEVSNDDSDNRRFT